MKKSQSSRYNTFSFVKIKKIKVPVYLVGIKRIPRDIFQKKLFFSFFKEKCFVHSDKKNKKGKLIIEESLSQMQKGDLKDILKSFKKSPLWILGLVSIKTTIYFVVNRETGQIKKYFKYFLEE